MNLELLFATFITFLIIHMKHAKVISGSLIDRMTDYIRAKVDQLLCKYWPEVLNR